jgi:LysM repeat protein
MEDRARVWFARVLAPLAFLAAATLLVVLVQRALDTDDSAGSTDTTTPAVTISTQVEETEEADTTPAEEEFYRIRTGDTLEGIAQRFDTTVAELEELNPGIDPLALTVGDRIRVS